MKIDQDNTKRIIYLNAGIFIILFVVIFIQLSSVKYPEIHCKHFFYGYPTGTPRTNDLIIRDIYALSSNDKTKFADWVAYRLDRETVAGKVKGDREWKADPWLSDNETLKPGDYKNISSIDMDRGHLAPLSAFTGTKYAADTNYLSNIAPQSSTLNQVIWQMLEQKIEAMAASGKIVYVTTGPLYERKMPPLPFPMAKHKVPSGFWKIVFVPEGDNIDSVKTASFIFDQNTPKTDKVIDHITTIDEIESRTGLDFLRDLPDDKEKEIEKNKFEEWAKENF